MQYLMQNLVVPDDITYLIVKVAVLLIVLLVWMIAAAHPAY